MPLPENIPARLPNETPWFTSGVKPLPDRPGPYKRFLSHRSGSKVAYSNWNGKFFGRLRDTPEAAVLPHAAERQTRYPNIPWCGRAQP